MTRHIAFATCAEFGELDVDDRLLLAPLARHGISVEAATWNDPSVDWQRFAAVILRSTWDYPDAYPEFLAWAASVARLVNPIEMVRWNSDKRYLLEMERAGLPIVPTTFAGPGEPWTMPPDWHEVVIKPATSVGSRDTARYERSDPRLRPHVERLQAGRRVAMLQPYQRGVEDTGETGLVYASGVFSHAFRKGPLLPSDGRMTDQLFAVEEITPRDPSRAELLLGERVMGFIAARFGTPVYARVDLLPGPVVIEVELIEPSLFLAYGPGSADRFATAIADAVEGLR